MDGYGYLFSILPHPDLVDAERHSPGEVVDRFAVGPLVEYVADSQQEHDGRRGSEVARQHSGGDRRRVEHGNLDLTLHQALEPFEDVLERADNRYVFAYIQRQQEPPDHPPGKRREQLVLKLTVQRASGLRGDERLRAFEVEAEPRYSVDEICPVAGVVYNGVTGAVIDRDLPDARDASEIIFEYIGVFEGHVPFGGVDPHSAV